MKTFVPFVVNTTAHQVKFTERKSSHTGIELTQRRVEEGDNKMVEEVDTLEVGSRKDFRIGTLHYTE